jgi:hypothetical protein
MTTSAAPVAAAASPIPSSNCSALMSLIMTAPRAIASRATTAL